jgi:hypothetical protein
MHMQSKWLDQLFRKKNEEDNEQWPDDVSSGPLCFFFYTQNDAVLGLN